MTTPEFVSAPSYRSAVNYRTLASAITVFLGGYLVISSLTGQLAFMVSGIQSTPLEVSVYFVLQALFAVAVVIAGLLLAQAPIGARLIASGVVVVAVIITVVTQVTRVTGGMGAIGLPASLTIGNGYVMGLLAIGAAWLIVRSARLGWLTLLAVFVLVPVPYLMAMNNIPSVINQVVALLLSAIIGAAIILVGRPLRD
jgi:hypothetical protein